VAAKRFGSSVAVLFGLGLRMQSGPIGLPGSPLYENGAWMCPVDRDELEERPDQGIAVCQRCGHRYKIPEEN
jgi:hypothetical protein